ncbi:MAG TPA: mucoidy inhibitor MuiA family protein [Anaerolineae bacterium]|nr:mucoidy inhibitor MuiA family protein [Anaerolineae bacterium]
MQVEALIAAVTVYPDRARVTRRGTTQLEAGTNELAVEDLTLLLDPDSVRAAGEGTARVRIMGVDVRRAYYTETPSTSAAELERQLQAKQDADQAMLDEVERLDMQLKMLSGLSEHAGEHLARGIGLGRTEAQAGGTLLSFIGTHGELLAQRRRDIAVRRRELAREVEVLRHELERVRGARPRQRYAIHVGVEALTAGDFTLELEYTTTKGASWQPLYDLRLVEGDPAQIELSYLAQVQQSTGEDWRDVELTLSTARPAVSAELPELHAWYLHLGPMVRARMAAIPPGMMDRMAGAAAEPAMGEEEISEVPVPAPAEIAEAEVETSGSAVTYRIVGRADVPADNTPQVVTVRTMQLGPQWDYLAVPKLVGEVYRRAKVQNDSALTLLPGQVRLFHGGEFVGRASLPKVAPQETFETTMGIEDRVVVERELVRREVGKQLIGDRRITHLAYEIEAQNLLPGPVDLVVKDQLPVAASEEIKVRLEEIDPQPDEQTEQGELTWRLHLASEEARTLRFGFSVAAPRGDAVWGLPEP